MASLREALRPSTPPNLRRGNARARCALCRHYAQGTCRAYGVPVKPTNLSDSFEPKGS